MENESSEYHGSSVVEFLTKDHKRSVVQVSAMASDAVVNEKEPRFFFAGCVGDIQRFQVRYESQFKVPNESKWEDLERVCKLSLGSKAKPLPPKQSVKFKCHMWCKITKNFVKKRLDAFSL